ncbi:hypothetical protein KUH03_17440 [Sphingobacterium sp. E70]|uniref:hypothetical protein n=1 Tax=Sphingobacterium sp. E70 TaxID=2853439 RepID=UPI00211C2DBF|nr:hypothetical protein [Sphingobacterium sp. E70]ULT28215.1 hypothetical protein KUH03_17440 [Sphingobacterium sp. E70]
MAYYNRLSKSSTVVKEYKGALYSSSVYVENNGGIINPIIGKEMYPIFAYRFAGLDPENGDPQGYLKDDLSKSYTKMMNDSLQYMRYYGNALPKYYGFLGYDCLEITGGYILCQLQIWTLL